MAAEAFRHKEKIIQTDALRPESSPEALWAEIRERRDETAVLAAGHEPMMSASVAFLLGTPTLELEMKKAALVCLTTEKFSSNPRGVLKWMLIPRLT
jgi:phosphohistidine phosphatase SixA